MSEEVKKPDNPSAFAVGIPDTIDRVGYLQEGMTLLDYFAGKALNGLCANHEFSQHLDSEITREAYMLANLMLIEREKWL